MKAFTILGATALAAVAVTVAVRAGPDNVKFPANYAKGVLYHTVDRADIKQYRELFITPFAADEAKAGRPLPSGTIITMVNYKAKLGADGQPEKDANGRFIKTDEVAGIVVMEKRMGWGVEYPPDMRNGEWEYRAFNADGSVNAKADLKPCFTCHLQKVPNQDFVFTLTQIKAAK
jgi:Cytochrome P460